jgi:CheY-like chemotaxis protein
MASVLDGIRIILVEDHEDSRDVMEQSLRAHGATVTGVSSAREALLKLPDADIIVTDLALPGEDGIWLCQQVRQRPRPVPVIAFSGYTEDQVPGMKHAGFARMLLKPLEPGQLGTVIFDVLRRAGSADSSGPARAA